MADSRTVCVPLLMATSRVTQTPRQEKRFGVPCSSELQCIGRHLAGLWSTKVVWLKPEVPLNGVSLPLSGTAVGRVSVLKLDVSHQASKVARLGFAEIGNAVR